MKEYSFISADFVPPGTKVDTADYEGGLPDLDSEIPPPDNGKSPSTPAATQPNPPLLQDVTNVLSIKLPLPSITSAVGRIIQGAGFKLNIAPTSTLPPHGEEAEATETDAAEELDIGEDTGDDGKSERRTFCPALYREHIINMMEKHYCAHPLIPGFGPPDAEVWVYLWENWYRAGRWELWARCVHEMIPLLKTTMIALDSWRRIKHDFLHHFHMPRCDLLVWILVTKLAPTYYRKLDQLLKDTGRYRELSSMPLNDAYKPNVEKWTCTCPSFVISRFLLCKHLIQQMHRVPPIFFLEAQRYRTTPFWRHKSLKPLENATTTRTEPATPGSSSDDDEDDRQGEEDEDDEDEDKERDVGEASSYDGRTFEEAIGDEIDLIAEFVKGLKYQVQFRDQRMLSALRREGASFLRLARACMEKEKRLNSTRSATVSTWEKSTSSAMFYRTRPTRADEGT